MSYGTPLVSFYSPTSSAYNFSCSIKNNRLRAELNDIDGYNDEDSDDAGPEDTPDSENKTPVNSLLQMASTLLAAARSNPIPGTTEIPRIFLRLTRLTPDDSEPRIGETINSLCNMGIVVLLGERQVDAQQTRSQDDANTPSTLSPTLKLNLDLSLLVAIVSDITHAPLPATTEEAVNRFRPLVKRWKHGPETVKDYPAWVLSGNRAPLGGAAAHSRSLTNQAEQEKRLGLFDELCRRLTASQSKHGGASDFEFYTTTEAACRLQGIVDKIGGPIERKRAEALIGSAGTSEADFYAGSRFKAEFLRGLVPVRVVMEDTEEDVEGTDRPAITTFQSHLAQTCRALLAEMKLASTVQEDHETATDAFDEIGYQQPPSQATTSNGLERRAGPDAKDRQKREKDSTTNSISPALTRHTVRSMLLGAQAGMTTVTANKASVRAILREMKKRTFGLGKMGHDGGDGQDERQRASSRDTSSAAGGGSDNVDGGKSVLSSSAAIWVVEPRSLAENMRADKIEGSSEL